MKISIIVNCLLTFLQLHFGNSTNTPETVDVNLDYYTGLWYQTYGDLAVLSTFERDAYCAYANYTSLETGNIGVFNWERIGSTTGPEQNITGYALETQSPGKFIVYFSGNTPAPYWVLKLGPIVDKKYQYSVVSDPFMFGLYVLARDVNEYYTNYDEEVMDFLRISGFDNLYNSPKPITQDECEYIYY